eukprot:scaffold270340_cov17-Tisochrysis_lutea.AAC.1
MRETLSSKPLPIFLCLLLLTYTRIQQSFSSLWCVCPDTPQRGIVHHGPHSTIDHILGARDQDGGGAAKQRPSFEWPAPAGYPVQMCKQAMKMALTPLCLTMFHVSACRTNIQKAYPCRTHGLT